MAGRIDSGVLAAAPFEVSSEMTLHLTPAKNLQRVFDMTRGEVVRARERSAA
jgi:hypothetical protein